MHGNALLQNPSRAASYVSDVFDACDASSHGQSRKNEAY